MPDLLATEQLAHGVGIAMGDDDQAANGVGVDPLRDELEAIAHKLAQRAAERLDEPVVVRVQNERDGVEPEGSQLLLVEGGKLGDERQQLPKGLEVARQDR